MARRGGAHVLYATLLAVALATHGAAAAVPIPSILATSNTGVLTFTNLKNTSSVLSVDLLEGNFPYTFNPLGSWADSKFAFTVATVQPGGRYRVLVTDLTSFTDPALVDNVLLPNGIFKPNSCPQPGTGPLSAIKTGSGYQLQLATWCYINAPKKCAKLTGQNQADVITVYTYQYTPRRGRSGSLAAGLKAVLPVPECQRASLGAVQLNNGKLNLLAFFFKTAADQNFARGDMKVFELRTAFAKAGRKLVKKLLLKPTYSVGPTNLNIGVATPSSSYSILASVRDRRGVAKMYSFARGRKTYVGGFTDTLPTRTYDSIYSVGQNYYASLLDPRGIPEGAQPNGILTFTTGAELKAGKQGKIIATTANIPYNDIFYLGKP